MTAQIIDGKKIAGELLQKLKEEISQRKIDGVRSPCLAVLLIGDNPASEVYVRNKKIACEKIGIKSISVDLRSDVSEEEVLTIVKKLNDDNTVVGKILMEIEEKLKSEKINAEVFGREKNPASIHRS